MSTKPILSMGERLTAIAVQLVYQDQELALELSQLAHEVASEYVPRDEAGEIPTNAQGQALARFLRPAFRGDARGCVRHGRARRLRPPGRLHLRPPRRRLRGRDRAERRHVDMTPLLPWWTHPDWQARCRNCRFRAIEHDPSDHACPDDEDHARANREEQTAA